MTITTGLNEQLLIITHQIRELEHAITVARNRRKWSHLSLAFGPLLALLLYAMLWIPRISTTTIWAAYIPAVPIVIAFCIAAYVLKRYPGGPRLPDGTYSDRKLRVSLNSNVLACEMPVSS